jgi:hypothetical protein
LDPEPAAGALKKHLSADTCIYRRIYRQKQANMNSEKSAYVPVCGGTNHEMCIYLFEYRQIQAQIMKMCIYFSQYRQIQANMNSKTSAYMPVCACMSHAKTRHTGTYELLIEGDTYRYKRI